MSTDLGLAADIDALQAGARRLHAVADELDRAARCSTRATDAAGALFGATAIALASATAGNAERATREAASLQAVAADCSGFADAMAEVETGLSACRVDAHGVGLLGGDDTLWPPPVDAPARVRRVHRQVLAELARVRDRERAAHEAWQAAAQRYADGDPVDTPSSAAPLTAPVGPAAGPAAGPGSPWPGLFDTGPQPVPGDPPEAPRSADHPGRERSGVDAAAGEVGSPTRPEVSGSTVVTAQPGAGAPGSTVTSSGAGGSEAGGAAPGPLGRGADEPAPRSGDVGWAAAVPTGDEGAEEVTWRPLYVLGAGPGAGGGELP